ncbi:helicase SNF2 [Clostridia bacterium]|nr:helicase SNF2 [Clostridia bacterium]
MTLSLPQTLSPFHALYTARTLSEYAFGQDRLVPAYASSEIEVYPYQVAAAMFALRSPFLKGVVLADEGGLGKTYEAMLVITQLWFEGKERILLVVPSPLLFQWQTILQDYFSVPFQVYAKDESDFDFRGIVLTTYDYAAEKAEAISQISWDVSVFEEAHRLAKVYTGENKSATALKAAVDGSFKVLLTATPMQNSIMDLYGLIYFIDETALPEADGFYKRYFRKPENYGELTATASRYCFRTLRSQVERYAKIPRRLPVTADFMLTAPEKKLSALLDEYLKKQDKLAFPKMDGYDLTLMFNRAISSSPFALCKLADTAYGRVQEPELKEMAELAAGIKPQTTGKGQALLKALKVAFAELKKRGANRKVVIFTESLSTIGFLHLLLSDMYKVLAFNGSKSSDYSVIKKFETDAEILIATDVAAEGFDFSFCSFVVNYDLPYNVLTLEQRIMRCHRLGQQNDVIVLNFLNRQNFADVRMLELINKRVSQFDGVFGMSDDVVGNFTDSAVDGLIAAFGNTRTRAAIESEYQAALAEHENPNAAAVREAENALFTTFTRDVADKVAVTPQYIKDRTDEINAKLWELTKWFFTGKQGYECVEENRTVRIGITPQKVFTGAHLGRREYSIDDKSVPKSGRHTVTGTLAKNIIGEIYWRGIPDSGSVAVNGDKACKIGYYRVKIKPKDAYFGDPSRAGSAYYSVFVGKTPDGQMLTDAECREIMDLPVASFSANGDTYGERDGYSKPKRPDELDELVDVAALTRRAAADTDDARKEEIESVRNRAYHQKQGLSRDIEVLKGELRQIENAISRTSDIAEQVSAEKRKAAANRELKTREQSLFLESCRVDADAEQTIANLTEQANLIAEVKRYFAIQITGGNHNE